MAPSRVAVYGSLVPISEIFLRIEGDFMKDAALWIDLDEFSFWIWTGRKVGDRADILSKDSDEIGSLLALVVIPLFGEKVDFSILTWRTGLMGKSGEKSRSSVSSGTLSSEIYFLGVRF